MSIEIALSATLQLCKSFEVVNQSVGSFHRLDINVTGALDWDLPGTYPPFWRKHTKHLHKWVDQMNHQSMCDHVDGRSIN